MLLHHKLDSAFGRITDPVFRDESSRCKDASEKMIRYEIYWH